MDFKEIQIDYSNPSKPTFDVVNGELPFFNNVEDMFDSFKENIETTPKEKVLFCDTDHGVFVSEFRDGDSHFIYLTLANVEKEID